MRIRKPLKLLLNFKLWGKIVPIEFDNENYLFAKKSTGDNPYENLYSRDGSVILLGEISKINFWKDYLFTITCNNDHFSQNHYRVSIIDMKNCKKIASFVSDTSNAEITVFESCFYDGYNIVSIMTGDGYLICNTNGDVIEYEASEACQIGDNFFYEARGKSYVISKYYFDDKYDIICENRCHGSNAMYFLGKIRNGEMIYQAMGSKGYKPYDYYFKKYSDENDGVVVKLCDENGEDLNTLAFVERKNGRFRIFEDAQSLYGFTHKRVFVTRKDPDCKDEYEYLNVVDLCYYDGTVIDTYRRVFFGFIDVKYGLFEKTLALVENMEGEFFYIDVDGVKYPIPNSTKRDLDEYDDISYRFREFKSPLE